MVRITGQKTQEQVPLISFNNSSIFQDVLNFSYVISTPPDMQYGSLNLDGTWTGIVNELIYKNADIGMYLSTVHNGSFLMAHGGFLYMCVPIFSCIRSLHHHIKIQSNTIFKSSKPRPQ